MLQILIFSVNVFCQESDQLNQSDSLGNKIGLWVEYAEIMYVENVAKHPHYFTRKGDRILLYEWQINVSVIKKIQELILKDFVINEFTEASGPAYLLLILDCEKDIFEIRIIRGITTGFNKELLRVVDAIEKDLIFICASNCQTPIVIPFAIRIR